ncbi:dsRNA-binding domain-like protein, partial [Wallemia mellicola CBS 633.66]
LTKRLAPECISQRPGGGNSKVCYIEGHQAIALTNSIFGYDGWSSQIMDTKIVYIEQSPNHKWHCTAQALARVTVLSTGAFHEDVGFGDMANSPTRGAAIDKCMKEAVTDAVKRCLRYFGNSTGNCLYDNNYTREIVR